MCVGGGVGGSVLFFVVVVLTARACQESFSPVTSPSKKSHPRVKGNCFASSGCASAASATGCYRVTRSLDTV